MTIIADAREKEKDILKGSDRVMLLDYSRDDSDATYSYDLHVICDTNPDHKVVEYKFERKSWPDFVQSWFDGKLERQLEAVDGLIIELDPLAFMMMAPMRKPNESDTDFGTRVAAWQRAQEAAMKHLIAVSTKMWVLPVLGGPEVTMRMMRYVERHPTLEVKANRVHGASEHPLVGMLRALPGFNPDYQCPDGRAKGDVLIGHLDRNWPEWRKDVRAAMRMQHWGEVDFGKGVRRFGPGTLSTIAERMDS